MTLLTTTKDGTAVNNSMTFQDPNHHAFFDRLKYQRITGRFCDVTVTVGSTTFNAHRVVLASYSPYFDSLFQSARIAKEKVLLRYDNVAAFEDLLNYLYSGHIVLDRSNVVDLLKLANDLMILRLKTFCVDYLQRYLDASNCVSVRALAERFCLPKLVNKADNFIEQNVNSVIGENTDILELDEADLIHFLAKHNSSVDSNSYFSLIVRWVNHKLSERECHFPSLFRSVLIKDLDVGKVERMVDFNPFFADSPKSLFLVLYELKIVGAMNPKYDERFASLENDPALDFNTDDSLTSESDEENVSSENGDENGHEANGHMDAAKNDKRPVGKRRGRARLFRRPAEPPVDEDPEDRFYNFDENSTELGFTEPDDLDPEADEADADESYEPAEGEEEPFVCEHCGFLTNTEAKLRRHSANAHDKNVLYVCALCDFQCKWNRIFYDHMRRHFPGPPFQCDQCPYVAEQIHILLNHRTSHSDEKPYKCSECDFRTRLKSSLIVHFRIHTGERPFGCDKCDKRFAIRATLQQHQASHSNSRPFTCEHCDFETKYQSHLISHRRIHTGDLFRCQEEGCDYSSPKKSQLAAHLRTHLAVRPHQCKTCNRSFIERSHLVRHERIHLKDKPFKCELCDYASSRRDKLKEHVLKHHNATGGRARGVHKHRRVRESAELQRPALTRQRIPPLNMENTFRPIGARGGSFDPQLDRPSQSASVQSVPNPGAFADAQQQQQQLCAAQSSMALTRQHSAPIPIADDLMMGYEMGAPATAAADHSAPYGAELNYGMPAEQMYVGALQRKDPHEPPPQQQQQQFFMRSATSAQNVQYYQTDPQLPYPMGPMGGATAVDSGDQQQFYDIQRPMSQPAYTQPQQQMNPRAAQFRNDSYWNEGGARDF